jgi:hypothetical protein
MAIAEAGKDAAGRRIGGRQGRVTAAGRIVACDLPVDRRIRCCVGGMDAGDVRDERRHNLERQGEEEHERDEAIHRER